MKKNTQKKYFLLFTILNFAFAFAQFDTMYWSNWEGNKIEKSTLTGTSRTNAITGTTGNSPSDGPVSFAVDLTNSKIYWYDAGVNAIKSANLNGTGTQTLVAASGYVYTLSIDNTNSKLYWSNWEGNKIERCNLNGTTRENIITGTTGNSPSDGPVSFAADIANSKIYWYDAGVNAIKSANLNGTGTQTVVASSGYAYKIILKNSTSLNLPTFESNSNLRFYPNPSKNNIIFEENLEGVFQIYDESGQLVKQFDLKNNSKKTINTQDLSNGIYIIKGVVEGQKVSKKLIIKH